MPKPDSNAKRPPLQTYRCEALGGKEFVLSSKALHWVYQDAINPRVSSTDQSTKFNIVLRKDNPSGVKIGNSLALFNELKEKIIARDDVVFGLLQAARLADDDRNMIPTQAMVRSTRRTRKLEESNPSTKETPVVEVTTCGAEHDVPVAAQPVAEIE